MPTAADSITCYLHGKDHNRPHLLSQAFTADARLQMQVQTAAIHFPALTAGRAAIAELLVTSFNQRYENVYTFCLGVPPPAVSASWRCDWMVVMSEKGSGINRVGCGRYDWRFAPDSGLVQSLHITIEQMQLLPPEVLPALIGWVTKLPYPWCPPERLLRQAPDLPALQPVLQRLGGFG
ncbi:hypothetical protein HLB44_27015 [Aquincola sp. S2]|uniref:Uncharacterized protein n=2 Tax=Pseudaquabacterium terrae TaxID=2732868 RepID=A0ABX2EQ57_9BURK|nr:hypothetical protein [Aquabacterium terrae]